MAPMVFTRIDELIKKYTFSLSLNDIAQSRKLSGKLFYLKLKMTQSTEDLSMQFGKDGKYFLLPSQCKLLEDKLMDIKIDKDIDEVDEEDM